MVILFGSLARGDATAESDIDLLVATRMPPTEADRHELLAIAREWGEVAGRRIDLLISAPGLKEIAPELRGELFADGIVLYGTNLLHADPASDLETHQHAEKDHRGAKENEEGWIHAGKTADEPPLLIKGVLPRVLQPASSDS